jgi:YD repeat-containing protein
MGLRRRLAIETDVAQDLRGEKFMTEVTAPSAGRGSVAPELCGSGGKTPSRGLIALGVLLMASLCMTVPALAQVAYVQGNFASPNSGASVSVTLSSAQTAGDANVVFVGWDDGTSTVTSVSDSEGNTYLPVAMAGPPVNPGLDTQVVYIATNIASASAGGNTVTVSFNTGVSYPDVRVLELNGVNVAHPVDVTASAIGDGSALNSGNLLTTTANDLLLASGNVQHEWDAVGSGYSELFASYWNVVEDEVASTPGIYSATSTDNYGYWVNQLLAIRPANTSSDTSPPTAPGGLIATGSSGTTGSQITLTWTTSIDDVGVTGYLIERCQGSGCTNFAQIGSSATNGYTDTAVKFSTAYSYRVRASDGVGNLSGYSNIGGDSTPPAALGFVQGNFASPNSGSSITVTFNSAQTAGNLNVVFVGWDDASSTVQSITDSAGNTYVAAVGPTVNPGNATQTMYYAANIAASAGGANTITVTFSDSVSYPDVRIAELSGVVTSNPLDTAVASYGDGATLNSGTLTTTGANELLIASGNVQHQWDAVGSGYAELFASYWNVVEDAIAPAAGTYSAADTDNYGYWVMQLAAFKAANPPPSTAPPSTPTNLSATDSSGSVNLTWTGSSDSVGVAGYLIYRCQGTGCSNFTEIGTATGTSFADTSASGSSGYTYEIVAIDSLGNVSGDSSTATSTNAFSGAATYQYDFNKHLTSITYANGGTLTYSYDAAGNLIRVSP